MKTTECKQCKKNFEHRLYDKRVFCSKNCTNKFKRIKGKADSVEATNCKTCGKEVQYYVSKPRQFCSIYCSNISRRKEKNKKNWDGTRVKRDRWLADVKLKKFDDLMNTDFKLLGFGRQRTRIIIEQQGKCNRCNLHEWMNEPIAIEIDHKDGDNKNNTRDNMEGLCPNCHSLTETWRGRNFESSVGEKVGDEELLVAINETKNIRQALMKVGLAAKGANYKRAKDLLH